MGMTLNSEKLAEMLRSKRGSMGLRAVANEIGDVSASTLSRIEQGHLPDIQTFFKLCAWLEVPTDFFNEEGVKPVTAEKEIVAHLRAERTLDRATAESLIKMITLAYEHTKKDGGKQKSKR